MAKTYDNEVGAIKHMSFPRVCGDIPACLGTALAVTTHMEALSFMVSL